MDIQRKPGSTPTIKTVLDVEVTEGKSTGEITFGAGFSTTDGPLVDVGMHEKNFLGGGQDLRARATLGANRQNYDLGITEPYFLDREIEAGFDLYKTVRGATRITPIFDRDTDRRRLQARLQPE